MMMLLRKPVRSLLLAIGLVWASAAGAQAFTIQEVTSPGGIKAWLVEEHAIPLMAMNFSFRGGAEYDPPGKEGLTTFLSGMLDEGAGELTSAEFQKKRDELAFRMSFDGGSDFFEGGFQTITRNRDASVALMKLAITAPRFDAEPLARVRQQYLLNVKEKDQDPQSIAWQAWMQEILPGDPYSRPDDGTEATISAITADDLRAAHRRIFNRDTLQVAVVGDISAKELGPLLDELFGALPEKGPDLPKLPAAKPVMGPKLQVIDRDMPQSVIVFGTEGIMRDDPDFIPAFVMSEILGSGGLTSLLSEEIREKRGLTYGVSYGLSPLGRVGLYAGQLQTKNASAGEALDTARQVIARYAAEGPSQKDLDEAKTFLTGSYGLRFSSNAAIAGQLLGIQQQKLGIDYVQKRNQLIDAVTLDQVKAQAKRLLHPDRLLVTVVGRPEGVK